MSWTPRQIPPSSFDVDGSRWMAVPFGSKGHLRIRLEAEYDAMTGQAVAETLVIPYPHRIVEIEVKHTTATGANDTTALTAGRFERYKWPTCAGDADWFILWDYAVLGAVSDFLNVSGDGWEYPPCKYRFVTNTTDGHRMYYELIIQILEPAGHGRMKGKEYVSRA